MIWGLLKKEFYNLRLNLIVFGVIYLIFVVCILVIEISVKKSVDPAELILFSGEMFSLSVSVIYLAHVFSTSIIVSSYQIDEKSNWNRYVVANGVPRKKLIYSKVLLILLLSLVGSLLVTLCVVIIPEISVAQVLGVLLVTFSGTTISSMLVQFISILIGGIKANILYGLILVIGMFVIPVIVLTIYGLEDDKGTQYALIFGVFGVCLLLDICLFFINQALVSRRDY